MVEAAKYIVDTLNEFSSNALGYIFETNKGINDLNETIIKKNDELEKILTTGGNKKTFLTPSELQSTYKKIKMTGGSKSDINNMIYTIEKMQNMGIHRDFFPKLLQALKAHH